MTAEMQDHFGREICLGGFLGQCRQRPPDARRRRLFVQQNFDARFRKLEPLDENPAHQLHIIRTSFQLLVFGESRIALNSNQQRQPANGWRFLTETLRRGDRQPNQENPADGDLTDHGSPLHNTDLSGA